MFDLLREIAEWYNMPLDFVRKRADNPDYFYHQFSLRKKSGGFRKIEIPTPELKLFQRYILDHYLSKIEISPYARAYVKGKNIADNVSPHARNLYFLHADIASFFDSIDLDEAETILYIKLNNVLPPDSIADLLHLCSFKGHIPQGAVTSPCLSNIFFKEMDEQIGEWVSHFPDGVYTRYSDDITISSSLFIKKKFRYQLQGLLQKKGLEINEHKTYFSCGSLYEHVTGINIVDGRLSVGFSNKKQVKKEIYSCLLGKKGANPSKTRGYLSYLRTIEPDYYSKLKNKYRSIGSQEAYEDLFH